MHPGPGSTLKGSLGKILLMLWLLGMAVGKPVQKEDNATKDCPDFQFEGCDFFQRLCEEDFETYSYYGDFGTITWQSHITPGASGARQGVLMVEPNLDADLVRIFLGLKKPKGWAFGITDLLAHEQIPQPANGDASEIHNHEKQLILYENSPPGSEDDGLAMGFIGRRVPLNFLGDYFVDEATRFDVTLLRDRVVLNTQPHVKGTHVEFQDKKMFKFDNGFAIGLNRDPADPPNWARSGSGVYAVCVKIIGQKKQQGWW